MESSCSRTEPTWRRLHVVHKPAAWNWKVSFELKTNAEQQTEDVDRHFGHDRDCRATAGPPMRDLTCFTKIRLNRKHLITEWDGILYATTRLRILLLGSHGCHSRRNVNKLILKVVNRNITPEWRDTDVSPSETRTEGENVLYPTGSGFEFGFVVTKAHWTVWRTKLQNRHTFKSAESTIT